MCKKKDDTAKKPKAKMGRPIKWTEEKLDELGDRLKQFVLQEGIWHISQFELANDMTLGFLKILARDKPYFSHNYLEAKQSIAMKAMNHSMMKSPNNWMLRRIIRMNSKDDIWKDHLKDRAEEVDLEIKKDKAKIDMMQNAEVEAGAKFDLFNDGMDLLKENLELKEEIRKLKNVLS